MADQAELQAAIAQAVSRALAEDVGAGDRTTEATVGEEAVGVGRISQKEEGVVYGLAVVAEVYQQLDPAVAVRQLVADGSAGPAGRVVAAVEGPVRALLTGERTALNFLSHLSGVATQARRAVAAVAGTKAKIVDTRKTTPGLRLLEKAAVRAGGGHNHRCGLYDRILIKDNHIAAAGSITRAIELVRHHDPTLAPTLEVEVANLEQLEEALAAGAPRILLDNMEPNQLREAVRVTAGRALLEASGGVTPEGVGEVARCGVDWVSLGWITHSAPALDLTMNLEKR